MIKKLFVVSISLAISSVSYIVHAEATPTAEKVNTSACAGCHGSDGNSAMSSFPKLAGQHSSYLINQLQAFKNGTREAPMMASLASSLSDEKMQELADFYAKQTISKNSMPKIEEDDDDIDLESDKAEQIAEANQKKLDNMIALGHDLYRNGDLEREVSACIACHGPLGEGNKPAAFPALKGQHADYLIKTLMDFKKGIRNKNPESMMYMIAKKMTEEEIKAVSYYISIME